MLPAIDLMEKVASGLEEERGSTTKTLPLEVAARRTRSEVLQMVEWDNVRKETIGSSLGIEKRSTFGLREILVFSPCIEYSTSSIKT